MDLNKAEELLTTIDRLISDLGKDSVMSVIRPMLTVTDKYNEIKDEEFKNKEYIKILAKDISPVILDNEYEKWIKKENDDVYQDGYKLTNLHGGVTPRLKVGVQEPVKIYNASLSGRYAKVENASVNNPMTKEEFNKMDTYSKHQYIAKLINPIDVKKYLIDHYDVVLDILDTVDNSEDWKNLEEQYLKANHRMAHNAMRYRQSPPSTYGMRYGDSIQQSDMSTYSTVSNDSVLNTMLYGKTILSMTLNTILIESGYRNLLVKGDKIVGVITHEAQLPHSSRITNLDIVYDGIIPTIPSMSIPNSNVVSDNMSIIHRLHQQGIDVTFIRDQYNLPIGLQLTH